MDRSAISWGVILLGDKPDVCVGFAYIQAQVLVRTFFSRFPHTSLIDNIRAWRVVVPKLSLHFSQPIVTSHHAAGAFFGWPLPPASIPFLPGKDGPVLATSHTPPLLGGDQWCCATAEFPCGRVSRQHSRPTNIAYKHLSLAPPPCRPFPHSSAGSHLSTHGCTALHVTLCACGRPCRKLAPNPIASTEVPAAALHVQLLACVSKRRRRMIPPVAFLQTNPNTPTMDGFAGVLHMENRVFVLCVSRSRIST